MTAPPENDGLDYDEEEETYLASSPAVDVLLATTFIGAVLLVLAAVARL